MNKSLWIKIGNSRVAWTWSSKKSSCARADFSAQLPKLAKKFSDYEWNLSSVVPETTSALLQFLRSKKIKYVQIQVKDLSGHFAYQKGLGIDRALNIQYVHLNKLYPAIVIDFGTATTVEFISSKGVHLGGWILPGPELLTESLAAGTSLLPKVKMKKSTHFVGKSTMDCISVGVHQSLQAIVRHARHLGLRHLGRGVKMILTGGWARDFKIPDTEYREDLSLESHRLLKGNSVREDRRTSIRRTRART